MKIIYLLIVVFISTGCNKDDLTATLNGKWKVTKYHHLRLGTSESEPPGIASSIVLDFSDNAGKGKMTGHTVMNVVSGEYELMMNNKMKTLSFGGTKVGEPNWGNKFWDAIQSAGSYDRQGDKLSIYFNADTEIIEFHKQ